MFDARVTDDGTIYYSDYDNDGLWKIDTNGTKT